jgi:hypothetical protein
MFIEKVKYKKIIIFSLLALGLLILIFYNQKEEETLIENNSSNEISQNNMIENVNYSYEDPNGNLYTVSAIKGEFDIENSQIIFMTDVSANLLMTNGANLKINSDYGKYNISNNDTIFSKNIIIKLEADIIEIDIISKMIKVLMHNQNEKVKINIKN